eukprot:14525667-Alexandrium_andersonii.AAC.1
MPWGGHDPVPPAARAPPAPPTEAEHAAARAAAAAAEPPLPIGGVPLSLAGPFATGMARMEAVLAGTEPAAPAAPAGGPLGGDGREDTQ